MWARPLVRTSRRTAPHGRFVARRAVPGGRRTYPPTEPPATPSPRAPSADAAPTSSAATAALVRQVAAGRGIVPLRQPAVRRPVLVYLGHLLLFDPILSGNRDIS